MNIKQRAAIGMVAILSFVYFTNSEQFSSSGLTNDEIQSIVERTTESFVDAEREVLGVNPEPNPKPVVPLGPDPDVKKCICKGTGKIIQGDGHTTNCPYHSVSMDIPMVKHLHETEIVEMEMYYPTTTLNKKIEKKNYRRPLLWFLRGR